MLRELMRNVNMNKLVMTGNCELINRTKTAFLCSRKINSGSILKCYDWATSLDKDADCVISGFQSKIERDVLHFLLKKEIPVIVVFGRRMYKKLPDELDEACKKGKVLIISLSDNPRNSIATAEIRNRYIVDHAENIVFGSLNEESSLYPIYLNEKEKNNQIKLL